MSDLQIFHLRPEGEKAFGYAQAVRTGNILQLSGSMSVGEDFQPLHAGDMTAQVGEVYGTIARTLAVFGSSLTSVIKETIYVTDMDAFLVANSTRLAVYDGHYPAATAVEVRRLAFAECMIEVEVTALL